MSTYSKLFLLSVSALLFLSACGRNDATISTVAVGEVWSDPSTWGGSVPEVGASVTIPAGKTVILDTDISPKTLTVNGSLRCANQDLNITADWIMVHGLLECGTEAQPYTQNLVLTLTGDVSEQTSHAGTKFLTAMDGGTLQLHGEERTSWLMLDATAEPNAQTIELESAPNWRVGDEIVITTTSQSRDENEVRTIEAIDGSSLTLDAPLDYRHFGERMSFDNGATGAEALSWDVDTRGEVALLSRNIKIQGDDASADSEFANEGFGAHLMVMDDASAYISGVELYRVGQTGILGRYPFHWHMTKDAEGQYIKNSSIHESYSRCVTVHGTLNALVQDNVCYKHLGHGYFLEDGIETGNVFDHNIGIKTIKPRDAVALIPSDIQEGLASRGPSTYWIPNGDNTFTNNAAVASDGLGFWYDTQGEVTGLSRDAFPGAEDINPNTTEFGTFEDNRAHSLSQAISNCTNGSGHAGMQPKEMAMFKTFTVFHAGNGAVWPCQTKVTYEDFRILDSGGATVASFVSPNGMVLRNTLFVANTELSPNPKSRRAIGVYDFGVDMQGIHFENYTRATDSSAFRAVRGAASHVRTRIENGTTKNTDVLYAPNPVDPSFKASIVNILDDSFGSGDYSVLMPTQGSTVYTDEDCEPVGDTAHFCDIRFAQLRIMGDKNNLPDMTVTNYLGETFTKGHLPSAFKFYLALVPLNTTERQLSYTIPDGFWNVNDSMELVIDNAHGGELAKFVLENVPASFTFDGGMEQVNSKAAVASTAGNVWYRDGDEVHVSTLLEGSRWTGVKRLETKW